MTALPDIFANWFASKGWSIHPHQQKMLERAEDHVHRSPKLLGHRARLAAVNGDTSGAKRDLKKARKLNPELEIYERVERAIKPARSSWWRW